MSQSISDNTLANDPIEKELEKIFNHTIDEKVQEDEIKIEKEIDEIFNETETISEKHIANVEIKQDETIEEETTVVKTTRKKEKTIKEPAITISYLAKNIENKTIKTNKDFEKVIQGHWEYKPGITGRELQKATKAAKISNGDTTAIDLDILKKNLRKVLNKVKK